MKKLALIFVGFILAVILLGGLKVRDFYNSINTTSSSHSLRPTLPPEKTSYNILLMGIGGPGHEGEYLTDTLILAHIDIKTKQVFLISLPRDLWVHVPTKSGSDFHAKINSVYEMGMFPNDFPDIAQKYTGDQGAADLVKEVVGSITGLQVDNYITINFAGFKNIIDTLGGVDVNVQKSFDDYEYPLDGKEEDTCGKKDTELEDALKQATVEATLAFPCRYEHLHFDKGVQHMDGTTALKYVRSRHSLQDGTDFGRASRQQQLIEAVKEKVLSIGFLPKIIPLLDESKKHIKMDIEAKELEKFLFEAKKNSAYTITKLVPDPSNQLKNGVAENGQFILIPEAGMDQWDEMKAWIANAINSGASHFEGTK